MARDEDVSSEHFDWLVEARSRNQRSTAALYKIIEQHALTLEKNVVFQGLAQNLTAVTFSLWRAVFLSDLTGDLGNQLADVRRFLRSLIAHNTVLYQTDFTSREWAFRYYLHNAVFRLKGIPEAMSPSIQDADSLWPAAGSAKDEWIEAQQALEMAISNFAKAIGERD